MKKRYCKFNILILHNISDKGIALLLSLAALVTMSIVVTGIVRITANSAIAERRQAFEREASALVQELTLQLPGVLPDLSPLPGPDPWIRIIDSTNDNLQIRVHGIDLSGRLHIKYLDTLARLGLPSSLQNIYPDDAESGIPVLLEELAQTTDDVRVFPSPGEALYSSDDPQYEQNDVSKGDPRFVFHRPDAGASDTPGEPPVELVTLRTILCEWITVVGPGYLNVNTCPMDLLKEALSDADATAAHECILLREESKPVPDDVVMRLGELPNLGQVNGKNNVLTGDENKIRFTNKSLALGLLVEVSNDVMNRRWWMTLERKHGKWIIIEKRRIYP